MNKNNRNLIIINCVFICSLLIANIVAGKVVNLFGFIVPAAVTTYPITFLCTDVISEIWGKKEANLTVKIGIFIQLFSLILIAIAIALPSADFSIDYANNLKLVLGQNIRMVIASLIAYIVAQTNDVFIFHKLKELNKGKHKWIRNNVSTMTSQLIDTAIFITIAFYGTVPNVLIMVISQYVVKVILALLDTPFFYLLTINKDK
ncbi:queuosine precursor transporter [Peptostreptococcus sp. D1]|uniref:queuosine precursor transporter n=1 Tax=Peptostreptococcus sp. D1 TaxID=72304 RepID=UPI0008E4FEC7|nr:queuosine precursor transporter [Peptostreptococcus sp. D1]SFE90199.1 hypothetical protein SAMN02910278_02015 [Peptostreptococcus sp. D1]